MDANKLEYTQSIYQRDTEFTKDLEPILRSCSPRSLCLCGEILLFSIRAPKVHGEKCHNGNYQDVGCNADPDCSHVSEHSQLQVLVKEVFGQCPRGGPDIDPLLESLVKSRMVSAQDSRTYYYPQIPCRA